MPVTLNPFSVASAATPAVSYLSTPSAAAPPGVIAAVSPATAHASAMCLSLASKSAFHPALTSRLVSLLSAVLFGILPPTSATVALITCRHV